MHIYGAGHPTQLALSDIEDSVDTSHLLSSDLIHKQVLGNSIAESAKYFLRLSALTMRPSHASVATCSTAGFNFASRKKYMSSYCC